MGLTSVWVLCDFMMKKSMSRRVEWLSGRRLKTQSKLQESGFGGGGGGTLVPMTTCTHCSYHGLMASPNYPPVGAW